MFFVDMVGAQDTCYKQAEPIVAGTGEKPKGQHMACAGVQNGCP